ncbi:bark storage protein A [Coffea arabica]|uniref:Bark storage protein A n=1 Tax=Coffea arabica TaxID=13443 RepID=A0A6P6VPC9_COFAR|nr:bark storage protein A-like [Coffea arabica]
MAGNQVKWLLLMLVFVSSLIAVSSERKAISASRTFKELNRNGPYLGLITVFAPEEDAFFATGAFKPNPKHPYVDLSGRRFRVGSIGGSKVIYVRCGEGMVNAAAATQQMLDVFRVIGIVHFGIAGNANNSMSIGDVIIPKQFAQTGLWDWVKFKATIPTNDVAELDFGSYDVPNGGDNELGSIGYSTEFFYSKSGKPNAPERTLWFQTSQNWLEVSSRLEGMALEQCVNSSLCLPEKPKVVVGLNGATANIFVDNAAYREFLYTTFHVSSLDMESAAVVMTCLSNGFKVIVIRGLSDLAGAEDGDNTIRLFGPLAASNVAKAVVQFVKTLRGFHFQLSI